MAIQQYRTDYRRLERRELDAWEGVAPAIVGDCMNRAQVMAARIKPLSPGIRLIGQARTVNCMVGDNAAIHVAIDLAEPGEVLVVDARAHLDTAVWGGIMTRAAMQRGLAGIVLDGALRDAAEIRELGFAAFCAGVVPAGPSKGFGGVIDGAISCGGVAVASGDLIVGDEWMHACMHAGARLSRAEVKTFRHNDIEDCARLLRAHRGDAGNCLIATEGVFSMDGDRAPVAELAALAREHDAWLLVDDAHALGVINGGRGSGFDDDGNRVEIDLAMGTLSKA
ncbi:MAG: aminotransferase class I/II-fold pyridoxal phosphate-dependent enzyme, partial [Rhodospirillaceae bacterium]